MGEPKLRQLQFEDKDGNKKIIPHEEAKEIAKRLVTTHMVLEAFIAGIPIIADGGQYTLLGADEYMENLIENREIPHSIF